MRRGVILLAVFLTLSFISAVSINYENPTPADNTRSSSTSFVINTTISSVLNISNFIFYWNGSNYTLYDSSLVLMMNFENNSAIGENDTYAVDSSIYGNNGTITGASITTSGKYSSGISFTNDSQYVTIPDTSAFESSNFTVSLWVNVTNYSVKQISSNRNSMYLLLDDGTLYSIGQNTYGVLGIGSTATTYSPVEVSGSYNFSSVSSTYDHSCGVLNNGTALCWGYNNNGQIGDNSVTQRTSPVVVSGDYNFSQISLGNYYSCGVLNNGTALCWGDNTYGQLGDNTTTDSHVPIAVYGSYNFSSISAGGYDYTHVCGILTNGTALCWGSNVYGQLGDNTTTDQHMPTPVYGSYNFSNISLGIYHTCGILTNRTALCWGYNVEGQVGDDSTTQRNIPTAVSGNYNFSSLSSGVVQTCGILTNGSAMCWGRNLGRLGDNTTTERYVPTSISGDYNISFFSEGSGAHSYCAVDINGKIYCWGDDKYGALGKGSSLSSISILTLFSYGNISSQSYSNLSIGGASHACGLLSNGTLLCWGYNRYGELGDNTTDQENAPVYVYGSNIFSSIATSSFRTCGILTNGSALCWGANGNGQIGDNTSTDRYIPTSVYGDYNFSSLDISSTFSCGILTNGSSLCWGRGTEGELGDNTSSTNYLPTPVYGDYNFSKISTGVYYYTCGLLDNGTVLCWGGNTQGQLGDNTTSQRNLPTPVYGDYNFSSISLGYYNVCGLLANGTILCWGDNAYGQLGDNSTTDRYMPTPVYGDYNFSSISAGNYHFCGLLYNGTVLCWGRNHKGQLGIGTTDDKTIPNSINQGDNLFTKLYSQGDLNFGVLTDGTIVSWGDNARGQQAFLSYNNHVPTQGFYKGGLISKSTQSLTIGQSFDRGVFVYAGNDFEYISLDSGFNQITLSYSGTVAKIYRNGVLNATFTPPILEYPTDTSDLILGDDSNSVIDNVIFYNRTLSDAEIKQLYNSNLKQINSTNWEFYSNESGLNEGTHTYQLFFTDLSNNVFGSALRHFIVSFSSASSSSSSSSSSGSNGLGIIYRPSKEALETGFEKFIKATQKVEISTGNLVEIIQVEKDKVIFSIDGGSYEVLSGETKKIDTNNDGYYDLEVYLEGVSGDFANMVFKTVYEQISSEGNEAQNDSSVENITDIVSNKISGWIIFGVVVVVLVLIWWIKIKFFGKRRR